VGPTGQVLIAIDQQPNKNAVKKAVILDAKPGKKMPLWRAAPVLTL
jgi:hypothetical protein